MLCVGIFFTMTQLKPLLFRDLPDKTNLKFCTQLEVLLVT